MGHFTLARKVDPRYKTNLAVLIMTIALIIARGVYTGDWGGSLVFSGGFFLTWALAREIDPLHELSAFIAAAVYLVMALGSEGLSLGLVFWMILLLRSITKITGKKVTVVDLLSLAGLGIYVVMSLSFVIPGEALQNDGFRGILLIAGLAVGIFYAIRLRKDEGIKDDLGNPVKSRTILIGHMVFLFLYLVILTTTEVGDGTVNLFFAVIMGTALYRVWLIISKSNKKEEKYGAEA